MTERHLAETVARGDEKLVSDTNFGVPSFNHPPNELVSDTNF